MLIFLKIQFDSILIASWNFYRSFSYYDTSYCCTSFMIFVSLLWILFSLILENFVYAYNMFSSYSPPTPLCSSASPSWVHALFIDRGGTQCAHPSSILECLLWSCSDNHIVRSIPRSSGVHSLFPVKQHWLCFCLDLFQIGYKKKSKNKIRAGGRALWKMDMMELMGISFAGLNQEALGTVKDLRPLKASDLWRERKDICQGRMKVAFIISKLSYIFTL